MAFEKRFKNDFVLIKNCEDFINALFNGDKPCDLLNQEATKLQFLKYFAGEEYESFKDFDHDIKITKKRVDKKQKQVEFIKEHKLEMYPHSSYSIFLNEKKPEYEKKNPGKTLKEIRSIMTTDWASMSEKEKEPFETIYNEKKQEFLDKVKAINPDIVSTFDKSQAPKAPLRPYTIFVKEQMKVIKEENPEINSKLIMGEIGKKWKALTEEGKKKYIDMCNTTPTTTTTTKPTTTPTKPTTTTTKPTTTNAKKSESSESKPKNSKPVQKKKIMIDDSSEVDEDEKPVQLKKAITTEKNNGKKKTPTKQTKSTHLDTILNDDDDEEEEEEEEE
jgi:hypothetical protein